MPLSLLPSFLLLLLLLAVVLSYSKMHEVTRTKRAHQLNHYSAIARRWCMNRARVQWNHLNFVSHVTTLFYLGNYLLHGMALHGVLRP